jgi:hypothetical protein
MAKTFTAPFAQAPASWAATATTAFALTGTGSLADNTPANTVLLGTAGVDGAIVTRISALPRATSTQTLAALFVRRSTDAANIRNFLAGVTVPAQTISATTGVTETNLNVATEFEPLRLGAGDELYVGLGTTQTGGIVFNARAVQF